MKKTGEAIAPIMMANGNPIKKHIQQQQHPLVSLAKTQGETMIPKAEANAAPNKPRIVKPITIKGTSKINPIKLKKAVTLGTLSTSLKNNRLFSPSTHW
jgi:hypothetical protein